MSYKKLITLLAVALAALLALPYLAWAALIPTSVMRDTTGAYIRPNITTDYILNTNGFVSIASSTQIGDFKVLTGNLMIGTTTPWLKSVLNVVGTTTVKGQLVSLMSSTTAGTSLAPISINWADGNMKRITVNANATIVMNATSSNPIDGGRYILRLCQDATGSRTVTFADTSLLSFATNLSTTTATTTANYATDFGFIYDAREQKYSVKAISSQPCTP